MYDTHSHYEAEDDNHAQSPSKTSYTRSIMETVVDL